MATTQFADLLKAAEDAGYSLCPVGTYDVTIAAVEAKKTAKGKDMFAIKYQIANGPHANRNIFNNVTISPESAPALGFFFRDMKAMGLPSEYFAANPSVEQIARDLAGKACRVEVGRREWGGEERENVTKVMPQAAGALTTPVVPSATPDPMAAPVIDFSADPTAPTTPF